MITVTRRWILWPASALLHALQLSRSAFRPSRQLLPAAGLHLLQCAEGCLELDRTRYHLQVLFKAALCRNTDSRKKTLLDHLLLEHFDAGMLRIQGALY